MRVLVTELKMLFGKRIFLMIIAVVFVLNAYLVFRTANSGEVIPADYKVIYSQLSGIADTEKLKWLDEQCNDFSGERQYNWNVIYELRDECNQIVNYREYLENIDSQADSMTGVSLFAKPDTFNYRSIVKTPSAYKNMKNVLPFFDVSKGIILATDNDFTDILIGFVVLFAVISLMISDRENGISRLLFSLKHGRGHLVLIKTLALAVTIFMIVILIYTENLIVAGSIYGLGDLSRPVQSLNGFIGSNLKINVFEYLILYVIFKFMALLVIGSVLSLIAVNTKNTVSFYSVSAIIFIAEGVCYATIHPLSIYSIFRYINLISFTKINEIFCNYKNINFWEYPIPIIPTSLGAILVIAFVCVILSAVLYAKKRNLEFRRIGIHFKVIKINRVHSKIYYTFYKSLVLQKGFLMIILGVLAVVFLNSVFVKEYNIDDAYYRYYTQQIEGKVTGETEEFMLNEDNRFKEIKIRIDKLSETTDNFSSELNELQKQFAPSSGFYILKERYDRIKKSDNAQIFYDTGYKRMFGIYGYDDDMKYALTTTLLCIFLISPLIAYDNKYRMPSIINSTASGKRLYIRRNVITASAYGLLSSLICSIGYSTKIYEFYGSGGLNAPLQCITDFFDFPLKIKVWQYIAVVFILRVLFIIFSSHIMLFISSKCKNVTMAVMVNFTAFALPIIVYLLGAKVMVNVGMNPLLSVNVLFNDFSVIHLVMLVFGFMILTYTMFCHMATSKKLFG